MLNNVPVMGTFYVFVKVRVLAKSTLRAFWTKYRDCEQQLKSWFKEAEEAGWKNPKDIKKGYPSASFLADNRVVFNIKGKHYRLIVWINYDYKVVWIRFIGTHAQYDKLTPLKFKYYGVESD